jgi:hypothetical protein
MGGNRSGERLTIEQAAREWRRSNEEAEEVLKLLDQSKQTISHYEDLCTNPEETLNRLFIFMGVDPQKRNKDFRMVEHHVVGNGMRLDSCSAIKLDERWKSNLSPADIKLFHSIAGNMLHRLGYYQ